MNKENLPLALYERNKEKLNLEKPEIISDEKDLFRERKEKLSSAVVLLPKSKGLIDMTLAFVSSFVKKDGTVILSGEKKAGIESVRKFYESNIGPVSEKIVGNHSAMYVGKNLGLGANKKLDDFLKYFELEGFKMPNILQIASLPGVFSSGELDEGSKILLENIPYEIDKSLKVLDMACGSGVIGAVYKTKCPQVQMTLCDSSIIAVETSKRTFEKNKSEAKILLSDIFESLKNERFDLILVNPPFHTGIATDYSFIERFSREASKHLSPDGQIYLVANSFLPYKEILEKNIGPTENIFENNKFKVLKTVLKI